MTLLRFLKIVLISFLSLLFVLISTALIIVYFYENEVKQIIVGQINKQLVTPVSVKSIELSLVKKFPNATLEFTDVTAESVQPDDGLNDTERFKERLFEAHKIFLQFNILDIFNKNYTLKKIDIEKAKLFILTHKNGNDNFHFWKKSKDTTAAAFKLNLEKINVSDAAFIIKNAFTNQQYSFVIKESELSKTFFLFK